MPFAHENPHGSARFASDKEIRRAFRKKGALPVAFHRGRLLSHSTDAGALLISGAGAGKFTRVLAHLMGTTKATRDPVRMVIVDPKGEIFAVLAPGLIRQGALVFSVNAHDLPWAPNHRLELFSHLRRGARTLVADCERAARNWIPDKATGDGRFFEVKARAWLAALMRALVHANGSLALASLRDLVGMIVRAPETWADIAPSYAAIGEPDLANTFGEMITMADDSPRTYQSVLGEITNALAPLNDPNILNTFVDADQADVSFDILTEDSKRPIYIFLIWPTELIAQNAGVLRQELSTLRATKQRKPHAPRIHIIVDEAYQLGPARELIDTYTLDRGAGITPLTVWQDYGQIRRNLGDTGLSSLVGSSDLEMCLGGGITDLETATQLSRKLGDQTLYLEDKLTQARAQRAKRDAIHGALSGQTDPMQVGMQLHALNTEIGHQTKMARRLMQPNEFMGIPRGKAFVFPSGYPCPPFVADAWQYFSMARYAGQYFPNPYFDRDLDSLRVKTWFGTRKRRVIREVVPSAFADFPQYQNGEWNFIEGYRPKTPKT